MCTAQRGSKTHGLTNAANAKKWSNIQFVQQSKALDVLFQRSLVLPDWVSGAAKSGNLVERTITSAAQRHATAQGIKQLLATDAELDKDEKQAAKRRAGF